MTRINLIPPSELHRKHLQAEYYELPEIFRLVDARQKKKHTPKHCNIPPTYRFGLGHKTFFYDKLFWLLGRHHLLVNEMHLRGYQATIIDVPGKFVHLENHWFGHWHPTDAEIELSRERINQRVLELGLS